jgi:hypothetical protein
MPAPLLGGLQPTFEQQVAVTQSLGLIPSMGRRRAYSALCTVGPGLPILALARAPPPNRSLRQSVNVDYLTPRAPRPWASRWRGC